MFPLIPHYSINSIKLRLPKAQEHSERNFMIGEAVLFLVGGVVLSVYISVYMYTDNRLFKDRGNAAGMAGAADDKDPFALCGKFFNSGHQLLVAQVVSKGHHIGQVSWQAVFIGYVSPILVRKVFLP